MYISVENYELYTNIEYKYILKLFFSNEPLNAGNIFCFEIEVFHLAEFFRREMLIIFCRRVSVIKENE